MNSIHNVSFPTIFLSPLDRRTISNEQSTDRRCLFAKPETITRTICEADRRWMTLIDREHRPLITLNIHQGETSLLNEFKSSGRGKREDRGSRRFREFGMNRGRSGIPILTRLMKDASVLLADPLSLLVPLPVILCVWPRYRVRSMIDIRFTCQRKQKSNPIAPASNLALG